MRLLVSCPSCERQYDAGKLAAGSRFRCTCGATLEAPPQQIHDAAVVRCSACGAPREEGEAACRFCGADFTLHERDLHTICPNCMARVSDRARFCHHCAQPLLPAGDAGEPVDLECPACGNGRPMTTRRLGEAGFTVLECPRCAGLWLSSEEFQLVLEKVRTSLPAVDSLPVPSAAAGPGTNPLPGPTTTLYRPCPTCKKLMHRRNFGRKSGVIVDTCRSHGVWFDAHELDGILRWMRAGGEVAAERLQAQEEREAHRRARLRRRLEPTDTVLPARYRGPGALVEFLGWLVGVLTDR